MAVKKTGKLAKRARRSAASNPQITLVDAVHQIWLAGMGALARAQKEGPRAFETLIVEGAGFIDRSRNQAESTLREAITTVQGAVEERMKGTRDQATETWDNLERIFQGRVQRVLQQVGVPTADEIQALMRRVDELNANVVALGTKNGRARGRGRAKAGRRRTAPRKAARAA
ncbi:MAG: phasin family protein [Steroidobacteraceae bacterium]|jgi:poly(hydroxyalkanoate) granule-associated protein|nr:phasin family protein [Steroidobacteraceae bacterium]